MIIHGSVKQVEAIAVAIDAGDNSSETENQEVVSFQKIVPMPEDLNIEESSYTERGLAMLQDNLDSAKQAEWSEWWDQIDREQQKKFLLTGALALWNIKRYGSRSWYSWRMRHWGTKWSAMQSYRENNVFYFETAWATPIPVIEKLSSLFPKVTVEVEYADEDLGHNTGRYFCHAGKIIKQVELSDSIDGMWMAIKLWHCEDRYVFKDGRFESTDQ